VCTDASPRRADVSPASRVRDAYAALAYARTLPTVDGTHVGLMGGSHGGSTTLASMLASDTDERTGFGAAFALYPACAPGARVWHSASGVYRPIAPLLILARRDDGRRSRRVGRRHPRGGSFLRPAPEVAPAKNCPRSGHSRGRCTSSQQAANGVERAISPET